MRKSLFFTKTKTRKSSKNSALMIIKFVYCKIEDKQKTFFKCFVINNTFIPYLLEKLHLPKISEQTSDTCNILQARSLFRICIISSYVKKFKEFVVSAETQRKSK